VLRDIEKRVLTDMVTWIILKPAFEKISSFQESVVSLDSCGSSSAVSGRVYQAEERRGFWVQENKYKEK